MIIIMRRVNKNLKWLLLNSRDKNLAGIVPGFTWRTWTPARRSFGGGGLSGPGNLFWAMTEWRLGCWPPWPDWLNTRWTWGWPETCSWWPRSGSRTGLSETESPLCLGGDTAHTTSGPAASLDDGTYVSVGRCVSLPLRGQRGPPDVCERLTSLDSWSRLWKLFLEREMIKSERTVQKRAQLRLPVDGISKESVQI